MKKYSLTLLFISTFLITSCSSTEPDNPSSINNSNRILFTRQDTESGISQIYSIKPDGTDLMRITNDEFSYSQVRWSPDGTKIAGTTNENLTTAGQHMFVMDADGSNKTLLPYGHGVAWSPDGTKLAFSHLPRAELYDRSQYIYTINIDGSEQEQLTDSLGASDSSPTWSLDGNVIYFTSNRENIGRVFENIYKIIVDNKEVAKITDFDNDIISGLSISPDNSKLTFAINGGISIYDLTRNILSMMTNDSSARDFPYLVPRWSPNGQKLVFYSCYNIKDGSLNYEILLMDIEDKTIYPLFDNKYSFYPDWCW